jgi:hypothetical protein
MTDNNGNDKGSMDAAGKGLPLKLGKTPAREGAVKLKFKEFVTKEAKTTFPKVPAKFGHEDLFLAKAWGMLGNDSYGDCVFAGAAHETMLWNKLAKRDVRFDSKSVLSDYSALTGFNINDPQNTDNGTDMQKAAKYRQDTGIIDADGVRHKVGAYLALDPGNTRELYMAVFMLGAVGIGFEFPSSAMGQFNRGHPWSVTRGASIDGGHYVPAFAKRANIVTVTWAQTQGMTVAFLKKYNDESVAYVSEEMLTNGKSVEGFDIQALRDALRDIKSA